MLYSTQNQLVIFIIFFTLGILAFYSYIFLQKIVNLICKKSKKQNVIKIIFDVFYCFIITASFIILNTIFNYGSIRWYIFLAFFLGLFLRFYFNFDLIFKITNIFKRKNN